MDLSYSKISTYLRCPQLYRLRYVDRVEPERVSFALLFGGAMHDALTSEAQRRIEGKEGGEDYALSTFRDLLSFRVRHPEAPIEGLNGSTVEEQLDAGERMVRTFYASGSAPTATSVEEAFTVPLGLATIKGFIDFVVPGAEGPEILELKTSRASYSQKQVDLNLQASVYALALGADAREVRVRFLVLTKTKTPKVQALETTRGPSDIQLLDQVVSQTTRGIASGVFPRNISVQNCSRCPYRARCLGRAMAA